MTAKRNCSSCKHKFWFLLGFKIEHYCSRFDIPDTPLYQMPSRNNMQDKKYRDRKKKCWEPI